MFFMKNKENLILKLAENVAKIPLEDASDGLISLRYQQSLKKKSRRVHLYINS